MSLHPSTDDKVLRVFELIFVLALAALGYAVGATIGSCDQAQNGMPTYFQQRSLDK